MSPRRRTPVRIIVQHICSNCGGRLVPFTKYEDRTISPVPGKIFQDVLTKSFNAANPDNRIAWCFSCGGWQSCERIDEDEIFQRYHSRRGVQLRDDKRHRPMILVSKKGKRT